MINLEHRPDRRDKIAAQSARLGVDLQFFPAVNGYAASDDFFDARFARSGPLGLLGTGDKACTLSHFNALEAFCAGDCSYCLMVEDDAIISAELGLWLGDLSWWPRGADVVKLEAYEQAGLVVLLGPDHSCHLGRSLAPLWSRHAGTCGYMISKAGARAALAQSDHVDVPIDHLLFNGNISALARQLNVYQLYPALFKQTPHEGTSDVIGLRKRPKGVARLAQELRRGLGEVSRLPIQISQRLFRGGLIEAIQFADTPKHAKPA